MPEMFVLKPTLPHYWEIYIKRDPWPCDAAHKREFANSIYVEDLVCHSTVVHKRKGCNEIKT